MTKTVAKYLINHMSSRDITNNEEDKVYIPAGCAASHTSWGNILLYYKVSPKNKQFMYKHR